MNFDRTVEIDIAAPPERIFGLVSDLRRHPQWAYNTLAVQHVDGPEVGPGACYRSMVTGVAPGSRKAIAGRIRVTKSDAPELFIYECTDDGGTYRWTFEVATWYEKTHVNHTVERFSSPWFVPYIQPLMWATFGVKRVRGGLANLKKLAEQPVPTVPQQRTKTIELPAEERTST
jgi:uncharacterized protein YndB with AHSA1/START domain